MEEDRISELPDYVLVCILSFLTFKEAARTSILSKRWRRMNICSMLANLNFSNWFLETTRRRPNSNIRRKNRRPFNVMNKILLGRSHESSHVVEKLILQFTLYNHTRVTESSLQSKLETWMKCVAKPGLTELSLKMRSFGGVYYDFPLLTLAAIQSLQKLTLLGFRLTSLSYGDIVRFSSLRSMCLWCVVLDDDVMQKLLRDSSLLENLEVNWCCGLQVLQVRQQQLKMVRVCHNEGLRKVVINAPKLEALQLTPTEETIAVETCLPFLRKIIYEARLYPFSNPLVEFRGLKMPIGAWFTEFLPLCPLLEHLTIFPTLHNINVGTTLHALRTLRLTTLDNVVDITLIAPNIETFYIDTYNNLPVVELNASNKLEVRMVFSELGGDIRDHRLVNFLGRFNHARFVNMSSYDGMRLFVPKEKRKDFHSPLHGTKYLQISMGSWRPLWEYVDFMLWLSPRATNLKIKEGWDPDHESASVMVLECVYEEKEISCTSSSCTCNELLDMKCWRHCLKEVNIQEFIGDEADKESLKTWFRQEVEDISITEVSFDPDSIYGGKYKFYDQLYERAEGWWMWRGERGG